MAQEPGYLYSESDPAHVGTVQLATELRTLELPFIFLTAYDDYNTIRQAASLQPAGYLIKLVNNATLFAAIQTALERLTTHEVAPPPTVIAPEQPLYFLSGSAT